MRAPARNDENGFTLVEMVIAMAIVFIVFLGLTQAGLVALDRNIENALRDEAVSVADNAISRIRALPFDSVVDEPPATVSRQIRGLGVQYTVNPDVNILNGNNRQVIVQVSWARRGIARSHQVSTIVRR